MRVGKSIDGNIFYDINLETDGKVPDANMRFSHIKNPSVSINTISQTDTESQVKKSERKKETLRSSRLRFQRRITSPLLV